MEDKIIQCKECGDDFVFSAGEQQFFQTKGFSAPQRCKNCRQKGRQTVEKNDRDVKYTQVTCKSCHKTEKIPFEILGDPNELLCQECWEKKSKPKDLEKKKKIKK